MSCYLTIRENNEAEKQRNDSNSQYKKLRKADPGTTLRSWPEGGISLQPLSPTPTPLTLIQVYSECQISPVASEESSAKVILDHITLNYGNRKHGY